jgi:hypothetical protein
VAGFAAAIVTGVGAQATLAQVEIERKPVLVLSGDVEILADLHARKAEPPRNVFFLSPKSSMMVDVNPTVPTMTSDGHLWSHPPFFSRYTLTNAGRLPLVNIVLAGEAKYFRNKSASPQTEFAPEQVATEAFTIRVPPLSPGGTYVFAMANPSEPTSYTFARKVTVTRIDTEEPTEVTLFVANDIWKVEGGIMPPFELPLAPTAKPHRGTSRH